MNNTKTLETSRLILRKFNENDYIKMFDNWSNDEKVTKYVSFNPHKNYNETKKLLMNGLRTIAMEVITGL